jgi:hypothetical protein
LVRDGGAFVGVRPNAEPATGRGITVTAVVAHPDGPRLGALLERTASGEFIVMWTHARIACQTTVVE